jgi:hypothetical protein
MFNYEKVIGIVMIYFGIANATHCHPNKFAIPSLGLSTHFVRRLPRKFTLTQSLTNFYLQ